MKNQLLLILILIVLQSCHEKKSPIIEGSDTLTVESNEKIDTIEFNYIRYRRNGDTSHLPKMILIKKNIDDTLSFTYLKEGEEYWKYEFIYRENQFESIKQDYLNLIDSIALPNQHQMIYKYEVFTTAEDGDGAYLFNPKFGLIAGISYSWGNRDLLSSWNDKDSVLLKEITDFLIQDTSNIWKAKFPPPPETMVIIGQDSINE